MIVARSQANGWRPIPTAFAAVAVGLLASGPAFAASPAYDTTDDARRIPVRIETSMPLAGTMVLDLEQAEGTRQLQ